MDDLISRQAAIDALRMDIDIIPYAKAREYARAVIETIYNRLEHLPSAQPQRMRGYERVVYCGECAHMMTNGQCREFADDNIRPSASDYCSAGEKRADMRE